MLLCLVLIFFATVTASQDCVTPTHQQGKCVLINHCPHLFRTLLSNQTTESLKEIKLLKQSHCGLEVKLFPKVCCPLEAVKLFDEGGAISHNQHSTKCGLHEPNGPSDPWLAVLEYANAYGESFFLCTGVLINKRYVLTAAHCVENLDELKLVKVHLGKFNGDPTNSMAVATADGSTAHEDYDRDDPNQYHDIALVRLKNKVSFKDGFVRPICIPMGDKKKFLGKTLSVTGYQKFGISAKKRDGVVTVRESSECHLRYGDATEVTLKDSQLCAGGRRLHYRHSHNTDLGGVLMHVARDNSYSAIGILSLQGTCCGKENYPKVYTKVAAYTEWIIANLKQ